MSEGSVVAWIVPLVGHEFDLEDLPLWLAAEDVQVVARDGGFALSIPSSVIGRSYEPVRAFAEDQIVLVNGVGRLLSPDYRPVALQDKLFGIDATGLTVQTVLALKGVETRSKAGSIRLRLGDVLQPDLREAAAHPILRAAATSPQAQDALAIIGRPALTWPELYLLFELVQSDVGGQMFDLGWISKVDEDSFSRTANSYTTLRHAGRHGRDRGAPPPHPMPHNVAVTLISKLVTAWLTRIGTPEA